MTVADPLPAEDITPFSTDQQLLASNEAVQLAIRNNDPVEDHLHVICVVSNPCLFKRRYALANEFKIRMSADTKVVLYVVELAYDDQAFQVTEENNERHLQIRTKTSPLWMKENLINIGVKQLLPPTWKCFAWIDADVEFLSTHWADDTLNLLNGAYDVVQLFSHCLDMDVHGNPMSMFSGFGFQYTQQKVWRPPTKVMCQHSYWHPGLAWAMTRKAYRKTDGLFDRGILGSGDHVMALSFIGRGLMSIKNQNLDKSYEQAIVEFEKKSKGLRLAYVPGVIRHFFHGSKANRKYGCRFQVLARHKYNPFVHVDYQEGLLCATKNCPAVLLKDIQQYFSERNEDECFDK